MLKVKFFLLNVKLLPLNVKHSLLNVKQLLLNVKQSLLNVKHCLLKVKQILLYVKQRLLYIKRALLDVKRTKSLFGFSEKLGRKKRIIGGFGGVEGFDEGCVFFLALGVLCGVACAEIALEQGFYRVVQIDFAAPAKVQSQGKRNCIARVNATEKKCILRRRAITAHNDWQRVQGEHHSLPRRTACNDEIHRFRQKEHTGADGSFNVGIIFAFVGKHAEVYDLVPFSLRDLFRNRIKKSIFVFLRCRLYHSYCHF